MRARLLLFVLAGCRYISDPSYDPAEPTWFVLHNTGDEVLYLRLSANGTPVEAALTVEGLQLSLGCSERLCSDACEVQACAALASVRALLPGEAIAVAWDNMVFSASASACGDCLTASRAAKGRYRAKVCYARAVAASGGILQRSPDDTRVLLNAVTVDETCRDGREFSLPSPDVHWGIELP